MDVFLMNFYLVFCVCLNNNIMIKIIFKKTLNFTHFTLKELCALPKNEKGHYSV